MRARKALERVEARGKEVGESGACPRFKRHNVCIMAMCYNSCCGGGGHQAQQEEEGQEEEEGGGAQGGEDEEEEN